jgi:uncharacterized protein DUF1508
MHNKDSLEEQNTTPAPFTSVSNEREARNAQDAPVTILFYKDARGEWRWRLEARNHNIVADSSEGYKTKWGCKRAARKFLGL